MRVPDGPHTPLLLDAEHFDALVVPGREDDPLLGLGRELQRQSSDPRVVSLEDAQTRVGDERVPQADRAVAGARHDIQDAAFLHSHQGRGRGGGC